MWSGNARSGLEALSAATVEDDARRSVVVAEHLTLLREGLAALCEHRIGLRVAASCADGEEALDAVRTTQPDAVLLDLGLPKLSAYEIIRRIREGRQPTKLLVLSAQADRRTVLEILRSGAHAFVLKSDSASYLTEALRHVFGGSICISPSIRTQLLFDPRRDQDEDDPVENLSTREHQVFSLLIEGLRAKEIAARLDLSAKTVDTYRASLMRKLDIHDVAGLVKFAIRRNLTAVR